jgi:NADPH:quinone reductase-like Zn-dependent oxidoreductase
MTAMLRSPAAEPPTPHDAVELFVDVSRIRPLTAPAWRYRRKGGVDVLETWQAPRRAPGRDAVEIEVAFASLNPIDAKLRSGRLPLPFLTPHGVGFDVSGVVCRAGKGAAFAPGERVCGQMPIFTRAGAVQRFVTLPAKNLVRVPDAVSLDVAAALPVAGLSALACVDLLKLKASRRVLVHGASGGVGHLVVQLAAARGALVTAVTSASRVAFVQRLAPGIDVLPRTGRLLLASAHDAVLDTSSTWVWRDARRYLALGGVFVHTEPRLAKAAWSLMAAFSGRRVRALAQRFLPDPMQELLSLVARGELTPHIGATYPFSALPQACLAQEGGQVAGKVVVQVSSIEQPRA